MVLSNHGGRHLPPPIHTVGPALWSTQYYVHMVPGTITSNEYRIPPTHESEYQLVSEIDSCVSTNYCLVNKPHELKDCITGLWGAMVVAG